MDLQEADGQRLLLAVLVRAFGFEVEIRESTVAPQTLQSPIHLESLLRLTMSLVNHLVGPRDAQ
jgi:hypothetical protein